MNSSVDTAPPVAGERDFQSILQVLERRASQHGSAPAMSFFHDQAAPISQSAVDAWSWRELRDRARGVAAELTARPALQPGARILLVYPAGLGFVAAFYGCLYAGMIPAPVPPPRRAEGLGRWLHVARDAGITGVLAPGDLIAGLEPLLDGVAGGGFCLAPADADPLRPWTGAGADIEPPQPAPSDLAFLQYTSGSTSEPKGVMISHGNMIANLRQISLGYELSPADRMASWLPHYHDLGLLGTILSPVYAGFPAALMAPAAFLRRPLRWLEMATHVGATLMGGPNFAFDHCVRRATPEAVASLDLSKVRVAYTGAETIRPRTLSRFHAAFAPAGFRWDAFFCCYGMAEATVFITGNPPSEPPYLLSVNREALTSAGHASEARLVHQSKRRLQPEFGKIDAKQTASAPMHEPCECIGAPGDAADDPSHIVLTGCGRPVSGLELAIVDPAARLRRQEGEVGEIWVAGPNIAAGYWQRPEQNAETFGLSLDGRQGWFRTGDLGFLWEGQLYVTGRLKDVIIIRGENHYPQDIEETASACHPALADGNAGAFAMEIEGEERLGLACEVSRGALRSFAEGEVFDALRGAISRHHDLQLAVAALIRPGSLPRTPSGKVRRFACRDGLLANTLPVVARWEARLGDEEAAASTPTWLGELRGVPRARREDMLRQRLQEELAKLVGLPAGQLPSPETGFFDLGLDSVAVMNFSAVLERELGLRPEPTLMFEHPTLAKLAAHLAATLLGDPPAASSARQPGADVEEPDGEDDAAQALAAEMTALRRLLDADPDRNKTPHFADGDSR